MFEKMYLCLFILNPNCGYPILNVDPETLNVDLSVHGFPHDKTENIFCEFIDAYLDFRDHKDYNTTEGEIAAIGFRLECLRWADMFFNSIENPEKKELCRMALWS